MKGDVLELVERGYRFDLDTDEWMSSICEAAASLTPGEHGAMLYNFDASNPAGGVQITDWSATGVSDDFVNSTIELNRSSSVDEVNLFYRSGVSTGTVSEFLQSIGEDVRDNQTYRQTIGLHGYADSFGVTASAPDHRGVVINSPLEQPRALDERRRRRWRQIGAHLQTAYRLRRYVESAFDDAEAILEPDGGVVYTEGEATSANRRALLQRAVTDLDRSRGRSADIDEALDLWTGLVDGRWSLVESFDTERRRFYLAIPNGCETRELFALTERERQVIAHVAQGDSNKWCAYQLGVTAGTVSKLLRNAMDKLGLKSRRELILLYHRLEAEASSSK